MVKIYDGAIKAEEIFAREEEKNTVGETVAEIIANVRKNGDKALKEYSEKFDKAKLDSLEVSEEEINAAFEALEPEFVAVIEEAAENIREFHRHQIKTGFVITPREGVVLGQRVIALERVGLYVPGGTASYPSSVLMNCIPAKLAGCDEIVMVTPPSADGTIKPAILVAAKIAGVDRIFKVGGAQAVAALAYSTETIPQVDKIVGPGNVFVAEAKRQVFGRVAIDMIAGPSEILVVADGKSNPKFVAADLLSQAEHDVLASAVLVTDSMELANAVSDELERQIPMLSRKDIARKSIDNNGKIIVADDLKAVIKISNEIAPEHLELCVDNPFDYLDGIRHAGSIFMGRNCPEALGDYLSGANHTLPTGGSAKFSSPLSVDDFVKKTQYTYYTRDALAKVKDDIDLFARKEGLDAHAKSATIRFED